MRWYHFVIPRMYVVLFLNSTKSISFFMTSSSQTFNSYRVDKISRSFEFLLSANIQYKSHEPILIMMTRESLYEQVISSFSLNIMGAIKYFLYELYTPTSIILCTSLTYLLQEFLDSPFNPPPSWMECIIQTLSSTWASCLYAEMDIIYGKFLFFLTSFLRLLSPIRSPRFPLDNNSSISFFK